MARDELEWWEEYRIEEARRAVERLERAKERQKQAVNKEQWEDLEWSRTV